MERFDVDGRSRRYCLGFTAKNARRSLQELLSPLLGPLGDGNLACNPERTA